MKTSKPLVLSIFGGERCVVSLDALEAAAHAIHSKAVRERETRAHPSTFGAEIEGQIRVINAQPDAALHDDTKRETNHARI